MTGRQHQLRITDASTIQPRGIGIAGDRGLSPLTYVFACVMHREEKTEEELANEIESELEDGF